MNANYSKATTLKIFFCLFAGSLWLVTNGCETVMPSKYKNLVLVTATGVRADHIRCYDYGIIETPAIDALAKSGIRFETCLTPVPQTLASAASILTSAYPSRHGILASGLFDLKQGVPSLPEILKARGYKTLAFVSTSELSSRFGLSRGFDVYNEVYLPQVGSRLPPYKERTAGKTLDAVEKFFKTQKPSEPFFLWIQLNDATLPYAPPAPFDQKYKFNIYDGEVAFVDSQVARLLQILREERRLSQTAIVFTAEHGQGLSSHYEKGHGFFAYQSTIRVPLIISLPDRKEGVVVQAQATTLDIVPTILPMLGVSVDEKEAGLMQGGNAEYAVKNPSATTGSGAFILNYEPAFRFGWQPIKGAVNPSGEWKYLATPRETLYYIPEKPSEEQNLVFEERTSYENMKQLFLRAEVALGVAVLPEPPKKAEDAIKNFGDFKLYDEMRNQKLWATPPDEKIFLAEYETITTMLAGDKKDEGFIRLNKLTEKHPNNPALLTLMADSHADKRQYPQAEDYLKRLVSVQPWNPDAWGLLGRVFLALGGTENAEVACEVARLLDGKDPRFIALAGDICFETKRFDEAISLYEEAISLGLLDGRAFCNLASAYEMMGEDEKALSAYKKARAYWLGDIVIRNFINSAVFRLENPDAATKALAETEPETETATESPQE